MTALKQAGCMVYRIDGASKSAEVLMVTSLRYPDRWLFPKGDIDPGETSEQAAKREAREESGASGEVEAYLGKVAYQDSSFAVEIDFFLMRLLRLNEFYEKRSLRWVELAQVTKIHHLGSKIGPIVGMARRQLRMRGHKAP